MQETLTAGTSKNEHNQKCVYKSLKALNGKGGGGMEFPTYQQKHTAVTA